MMKLVFTIVFTTICIVTRLWACTCIGESLLKDEVLSSDIIFHGRVIDKNDFLFLLDSNIRAPENTFTRYLFEVKSTYKGKEVLDTIPIITGTGEGDCGFQFQQGKEYIVYTDYTTLLNRTILKTPEKYFL